MRAEPRIRLLVDEMLEQVRALNRLGAADADARAVAEARLDDTLARIRQVARLA